MILKIVTVAVAAAMVAGCQSGVQTTELSADQQKKLRYVEQENVASFGAPPLIPEGHEIEIGTDVYHYENGGDACLACHADESEEDVPQTTHPERYNCLQCHVPQRGDSSTERDFKVDNTFTKYKPAEAR